MECNYLPQQYKPRPHSSPKVRKQADVAQLLRICAHPDRLILLCLLEHEARSVSALTAETGLSQPTVSQHLARLRRAEIAIARRQSKMIYYRLNGRHASGELGAVIRTFCKEVAGGTSFRAARR